MKFASFLAAAITAGAAIVASGCSSWSGHQSMAQSRSAPDESAKTAAYHPGFAGGNGAFGEDPVQPGAYDNESLTAVDHHK